MKLEFDPNTASLPLVEHTDLEEIISDSNSPEVTKMLRDGIEAAQNGNRADARALLLRVTEADAKNENAWLWLASISEYPEELLVFLNNVLSINPENERALEWAKATEALMAKTFVQRGIDAAKNEQTDIAKQCFLQAIVHDADSELAWLWLASVSSSPEEKISHLQKVLRINPHNENATASLKSAKMQMAKVLLPKANKLAIEGKRDEAQKLLDEIVNDSPDFEDAWMLKAHLADSLEEKIGYFEQVYEVNPDNQVAKANLESLKSFVENVGSAEDNSEVASDDQEDVSTENQEEVLEEEPIEEQSSKEVEEQVVEEDDDVDLELESLEDQSSDDEAELELEDASLELQETSPESEVEEEANEYSEQMESEDQEEMSEAENDFSEESQDVGEYYLEDEPVEYEDVYTEMDSQESPEDADDSYESDADEQEAIAEQPDKVEESENAFEEGESQSENDIVSEYQEDANVLSPDAEEVESAASETETAEAESSFVNEEKPVEMVNCPFCEAENDPQAFSCEECKSVWTLSDIEMLLSQEDSDDEVIKEKLKMLEEAKESGSVSDDELMVMGIGYINLKVYRKGFEYLQLALQNDQNNVMLNSQLDALAIRINEIEEKEKGQEAQPKSKTILIVDDSPTVRKLIAGKLEKCGHEAVCAVDGMDALAKINEVVPDLILLDITMPRMDGYQVCKLIRGNDATKEVPVVMISGKDGFFDKVRGKMAGTNNYITKPFGPETLMKTVNQYIS